ncbi:hypothetical protein ACYSNM_12605 [Myroides sp. LJL116]
MDIEDLVGDYWVKGTNQEQDQESFYKGILSLSLDSNRRIVAKWTIGQALQYGKGFFKNNILVIHFNYRGDMDKIYKGIAVYTCLEEGLLEGFWSEKYGDPLYLGTEYCTKITDKKTLH